MTKHYDTIDTAEYDGLIVDVNPSAEVFSVTIPHGGEGAQTLKRGTILTTGEGEDAYAILADDVEVPADTDAIATAYRTGHFARNVVKNIDGSSVTGEQEDSLRKYGILLSDALK